MKKPRARPRGQRPKVGTAAAEHRNAEKKSAFLAALRSVPDVSAAARAADVGRTTAYTWRDSDPRFAAAWDEALEVALDAVEAEVLRRAVRGVEEPVYYQGRVVGTIRRYSDLLAMFYLKAYRPKFRDRYAVDAGGLSLEQLIAGSQDGRTCQTCGAGRHDRSGDACQHHHGAAAERRETQARPSATRPPVLRDPARNAPIQHTRVQMPEGNGRAIVDYDPFDDNQGGRA